MKNWGLTRETEIPKEVQVFETKVFVSSNIHEVEVTDSETGDTYTEYEFDLIEYTTSEYIDILSKENKAMEESLTDTEMALVDLYEKVVGG